MHITITDIVGEKRIDLTYPIRGKEVAIISMFSENIQYQIQEPFERTTDNKRGKAAAKRKIYR